MSEIGGEDILRAMAEGADPETRGKTLEWIWARVVKHLGDIDLGAITFDTVLDYVGKRRREGAKGQTIRREVQALKRGLTMALRRGWVNRVPDEWPRIKSDAPDEKQRGKLVPPEILELFVGELSGDVRDEALFVPLTRLRSREAKRVRAAWVEPLPEGSALPALLRIPAGSAKNRRERIVGLPAAALDIIRRRVEAQPERDHVFNQENHKRAMRDAARRAGIQRVTLRDLRHTYATVAMQRTGDAVAVQAALGHTDLRTTQRYLSSTVARTVSAGASVAEVVGQVIEGSPVGGHLEAKKPTGARSSFGQSTGLLTQGQSGAPCRCCADRCSALHGVSHSCKAKGAPVGVTRIKPQRFSFGAA